MHWAIWIDLYNGSQAEITRADGDGDVEAVTFNAVNGGTYYFRIQGFRQRHQPAVKCAVGHARRRARSPERPMKIATHGAR